MSCEVMIRLGSHAEREYLVKTLGLFAGVIVGANLLESTPGATVSLSWKVAKEGRQFCIDPMTYVFALDQDYISSEVTDRKSGKKYTDIKRSFKSVVLKSGLPLSQIVIDEKRPVCPSDFDTNEKIEAICECVSTYQLERMKQICETDPQLQAVADNANPSLIFSPYFYIPAENAALSLEWENVCIRILKEFGSRTSTLPKHAVLCVGRKILRDRDRILGMIDKVLESGCDAVWLWVDALREEEMTSVEVNNLVLLTKRAREKGTPLWNMHGGFLSALLSKHGMSGFSHGIGYGESKTVLPSSGGALPTVPYHFNPLHVRSSVLDIDRAFSSIGVYDASTFHELICDCVMCKGTLKGDLRNFLKFGEMVLKPKNTKESQTADSAKRCRFHFLLARRKELDLVNGTPITQLKTVLQAVCAEYEALPASLKLRDKASALKLWSDRL